MMIIGFGILYLLAVTLTVASAVSIRGGTWGRGLAFFVLMVFLATWAGVL